MSQPRRPSTSSRPPRGSCCSRSHSPCHTGWSARWRSAPACWSACHGKRGNKRTALPQTESISFGNLCWGQFLHELEPLLVSPRPAESWLVIAATRELNYHLRRAMLISSTMPFDPHSYRPVVFKNNSAIVLWLFMAVWMAGLVSCSINFETGSGLSAFAIAGIVLIWVLSLAFTALALWAPKVRIEISPDGVFVRERAPLWKRD